MSKKPEFLEGKMTNHELVDLLEKTNIRKDCLEGLRFLILTFLDFYNMGRGDFFSLINGKKDSCFVSSRGFGASVERESFFDDAVERENGIDNFVEKINKSIDFLNESMESGVFDPRDSLSANFAVYCKSFAKYRKDLIGLRGLEKMNLVSLLQKKGNSIAVEDSDEPAKIICSFLAKLCKAEIREINLDIETLRDILKKCEGLKKEDLRTGWLKIVDYDVKKFAKEAKEKEDNFLKGVKEVFVTSGVLKKEENHPSLVTNVAELEILLKWMKELRKLEEWSGQKFDIGYFDFKDTYSLFLGIKEACFHYPDDDRSCEKLKNKFNRLSNQQHEVFEALATETVFCKEGAKDDLSFMEFAQKYLMASENKGIGRFEAIFRSLEEENPAKNAFLKKVELLEERGQSRNL